MRTIIDFTTGVFSSVYSGVRYLIGYSDTQTGAGTQGTGVNAPVPPHVDSGIQTDDETSTSSSSTTKLPLSPVIARESSTDHVLRTSQLLTDYTTAITAIGVLEQKIQGNAITVEANEQTIAKLNSSDSPPTIAELIDQIVNHPKTNKDLKAGETFAVNFGKSVYHVKVVEARKEENGNLVSKIQIISEVSEVGEGADKKLKSITINKPPIISVSSSVTERKAGETVRYSVTVDERVVFENESKKPRPLQCEAMKMFSQQLREGNAQALSVLGTGTGKSWIIAGITQATGRSVIVLPDKKLAIEAYSDALKPLLGEERSKSVYISGPESVEEFRKRLEDPNHQIILLADDPLFHQKAACIHDTVVVMDESHEHTYTNENIVTLRSLAKNNIMLGLTGTPTSQLIDILGQPIMTRNVRWAMDNAIMRQNYRQTVDHIGTRGENCDQLLIDNTVASYFARDEYLLRGPGYCSIEDIKKGISAGTTEKDMIDQAIAKNRLRASAEKNFVFTGNNDFRLSILETYEQIAKGTYEPAKLEQLQKQIAEDRREKEINARVSMLIQLHPDQKEDAIRTKVASEVTLTKVDIKTEIETAQKQQIANTINAHALSIIYSTVSYTEFEKKIRTGMLADFVEKNSTPDCPDPKFIEAQLMKDLQPQIQEALKHLSPQLSVEKDIQTFTKKFIKDHMDQNKATLREKYIGSYIDYKLESVAPNLPREQRTTYIALVRDITHKLRDSYAPSRPSEGKKTPLPLTTPVSIDLEQLQTHYTADATMAGKTQLATTVLNKLNARALHLMYPTKDVESFQQLLHQQDQLNLFLTQNKPTPPDNLEQLKRELKDEGFSTDGTEYYLSLVSNVIEKVNTASTSSLSDQLCSRVDLNKLELIYAAETLDQLRTGLIMNVGSDEVLATGTSIQSVLSTQQIIRDQDDKLNHPVLAVQLHGRDIRSDYLGAANSQIVSANVTNYVSLDDIYAKDSIERLQRFFEAEKQRKEEELAEQQAKELAAIQAEQQEMLQDASSSADSTRTMITAFGGKAAALDEQAARQHDSAVLDEQADIHPAAKEQAKPPAPKIDINAVPTETGEQLTEKGIQVRK